VTNWDREASTASNSANTPAAPSADAIRNAPAPAQPTAAAGSTAGNRGVTQEADASRDRAALNADASQSSSNRTVGTSGAGSAQTTDSPRADSTQARAELPRTASPAPLAGLIGLLALAGAFGVRRLAAIRG
jgi:cobalamin biosynthesis Mg chelatase CobN